MRTLAFAALLVLAGCASAPTMPSAPPPGPQPGLFVSPFGELFQSEPGAPWPSGVWFAAADADDDGRVDGVEFTADGRRFFQSLDRSGDGRLTSGEMAVYEQQLAEARARLPGFEAPGQRGPGRRLQGFGGGMGLAEPAPQQGQGRRRVRAPSGPLGYGPIAAAGWFNYPQPVKAADLDTNQVVTSEEWTQAADRWFAVLDTDRDGALTLATLPETPLQRLIERRR